MKNNNIVKVVLFIRLYLRWYKKKSIYVVCKLVFDRFWYLNRNYIFGGINIFCIDRVLFNIRGMFFFIYIFWKINIYFVISL